MYRAALALNETESGGASWRSPDLAKFPIAVNVDNDTFYGNIKSAIGRNIPWLNELPAHDRHAVIVGGGPSLKDTLPEIKWRYEQGQHVFALNNTANWLIWHGIKPYAHIILDARKSNVRFVDYKHGQTKFYIASQCAAELFDALKGSNVTAWHPLVEGIMQYAAEQETALIGGGTTVGLQAMSIVNVLGYRKLHLFGYDSSYRDGEGHAYPQAENENENTIEVLVGGKTFRCAQWMAHQADEFKNVAAQLHELGCTITVSGDGMLPHLVRASCAPETLTLELGCDLGSVPASFDFLVWLAVAEMRRAELGFSGLSVSFIPGPLDGFRDDGLPGTIPQRKQLFENVIKPALSLVRAREGGNPSFFPRTYTIREAVERFRNGQAIPKFAASDEARKIVTDRLGDRRPVVITLRESNYWEMRNSNVEAWLGFAETLDDAIFVRDTEKADEPFSFETFPEASKDLHIRMALYERARMNFFVANGPSILCHFSDAPFVMFNREIEGYTPAMPEHYENFTGIKWGEQYPWLKPNQRIFYQPDTPLNIERAWKETGEFAK